MIFLKKTTLLLFLLLVYGCGYSPLLNSVENDFYIKNLTFKGDRQINNYISNNLKKYRSEKENKKNYDVEIASKYIKNISNKDDKGNPKNYMVKTEVTINFMSNEGIKTTKKFERNKNLSAQNKKILEKELEMKYKRDLSKLLSQDIIFLLRNQ